MKNILFATLVACIMISATSCKSTKQNNANQQANNKQRAGGQRPDTDQIIAQMDANKDEKISIIEATGPIKNEFSAIDTNSDGYITKTELEAAPKPNNNEQISDRPQRGQGQRSGQRR